MAEFIRERLPDPVAYFESEGLTLKGPGKWKSTLCVFHEERSPSLRVNTADGGWACMGCGARGGDVLSFHMQRHGLEFVDAARALGAYRDDGRAHRGPVRASSLSARSCLEVLEFESLLVWTAAHNLAAGHALTSADLDRLGVAERRIHTVRAEVHV